MELPEILSEKKINEYGYGWMQNYDYEIKEILTAQRDDTVKKRDKQWVEYLKERWNGIEYVGYKIIAIPDDDWQALQQLGER